MFLMRFYKNVWSWEKCKEIFVTLKNDYIFRSHTTTSIPSYLRCRMCTISMICNITLYNWNKSTFWKKKKKIWSQYNIIITPDTYLLLKYFLPSLFLRIRYEFSQHVFPLACVWIIRVITRLNTNAKHYTILSNLLVFLLMTRAIFFYYCSYHIIRIAKATCHLFLWNIQFIRVIRLFIDIFLPPYIYTFLPHFIYIIWL